MFSRNVLPPFSESMIMPNLEAAESRTSHGALQDLKSVTCKRCFVRRMTEECAGSKRQCELCCAEAYMSPSRMMRGGGYS
jgi:hypothetical protein